MKATTYRFAHHRTVDGERCLIWGNGIGELLIPVGSSDYLQALGDRSWQDNNLVNSGEDDILNVYFRNTTRLTTFFGRLYDITTPPPTDATTLAAPGGTECAGTGYAGVTWASADFGVPADNAGSQQTLSSTKTFTAGAGGWSLVDHLFLTSVNNPTTAGTPGLIAWTALSANRTLAASDTLDVSVAVRLN